MDSKARLRQALETIAVGLGVSEQSDELFLTDSNRYAYVKGSDGVTIQVFNDGYFVRMYDGKLPEVSMGKADRSHMPAVLDIDVAGKTYRFDTEGDLTYSESEKDPERPQQ